jgi:hypothetical protein
MTDMFSLPIDYKVTRFLSATLHVQMQAPLGDGKKAHHAENLPSGSLGSGGSHSYCQ